MTYGALWAWTNHTLRQLRKIGVGRSDRVSVVLPQGPDAAVATLGVSASAVCVPLNSSFTADESRRYFGELGIAALVTRPNVDTASRDVAGMLGIPVIDLWCSPKERSGECSTMELETQPVEESEFASSADDAIILLTSGSTSHPKMVPLTHASVCLSAYNVGATLALEPRDRLLSVLPLFHGHGLISGVLAALAAGSSVVCTPGFDPARFFGWLTEFRPTWYTAVPAIHSAVLSAADRHEDSVERRSLRLIRSASSTLSPKVIHGLEARFGVPVIDTYGMTEAATQIAANPVGRRKPGSVGQSAGAQIAILDRDGRPLTSGERGEISVRGPTITRGYYNDPAATESAFCDGWFRTGDLGYLDSEGYLFIVGRIKDIIDRGGQKVAPAEVEEALLSHPDVVEVAAFSIPHERLGSDVAVAVVLRQNAKLTGQKLRDFARERLATFKVPGLIRFVSEIPKGPGGKVKRGELSATSPAQAKRSAGLVQPRSELEWRLAKSWADLLEVDHIDVDQDVFAAGADSIAVTQMIARLRRHFGVDVSIKAIFDAPTVSALATRLRALKRSASRSLDNSPPDIERVERDGHELLSLVQERILRFEREFPGLPQFNLPFAYRLRGALNVSALEQSLAELMRRHDSLRTGFLWRDGLPIALIGAADEIKASLIVEDLANGVPATNSRVKALLLRKAELTIEQESFKPFDVSHAPLFRARLYRVDPDDHVLLLVVHDIIIDGWSMAVFIEELSDFYTGFAADKRPQLPEPALQYSDFAGWQRRWCITHAANQQFAYWQGRLRNASPVLASNQIEGELASPFTQEQFLISSDMVGRLSAFSHSQNATLFMTLLAGFKALLLLRSRRNDICVATMMANRSQLRMERVIGPLANTTIIRTQMDPNLTFQEALIRVREAVLEAYARQELPFDVIAARLAIEDGLDPGSLVQFFFVLQVGFRRPITLHNVAIRPFRSRQGQSVVMPISRNWLKMTLTETSSGINGACRYKCELFEPDTIRHWIDDYKEILAEAAADPKKSLGRLCNS
jgi:acyl-CoA synthetase (AMP-forming)/AMP-acid ligase II/aryl carrier-like protein